MTQLGSFSLSAHHTLGTLVLSSFYLLFRLILIISDALLICAKPSSSPTQIAGLYPSAAVGGSVSVVGGGQTLLMSFYLSRRLGKWRWPCAPALERLKEEEQK